MEIEQLLNNTLEKGLLTNAIEDFLEMLQERLQTYELKDNLQKQYSKILINDETIEYNVFSKVTGKDYTIFSFQKEGKKIIKIPNLLLPQEINSRSVLNYKNGNFEINEEKTEIKNNEWEKKQETEEILKEGRIYFVDNHRSDYTQVIAVDDGKIYRFDFMQPYIGSRLKLDVNEGEYIIAKDDKFEKFKGNVKIQNKSVEEKIKNRIEQIKSGNLNREEWIQEGIENLLEFKEKDVNQYKGESGKFYIVEEMQENRIKISNIENSQGLTIKRDEGIILSVGDFIKTKNIGYERYDGAVNIENKRVRENLENLYNFIL